MKLKFLLFKYKLTVRLVNTITAVYVTVIGRKELSPNEQPACLTDKLFAEGFPSTGLNVNSHLRG